MKDFKDHVHKMEEDFDFTHVLRDCKQLNHLIKRDAFQLNKEKH